MSFCTNQAELETDKEYYLFTKSCQTRTVNIMVQQGSTKNEKVYIILEKPNSRLEDKFPFIEQLCKDNYIGVAVVSAPDIILLKANQVFLDFMDEPFNKRENSIGKRVREIVTGWKGSVSEEIWKTILETGRIYHIKESAYEKFARGNTYYDSVMTPIYEDGKLKYVIEMTTDVTDRVLSGKRTKEQAEIIARQTAENKKLIESQRDYLCKIIDNLDMPLIRLTYPDYKIIKVNQKAYKEICEIIGCNLQEGSSIIQSGRYFFDVITREHFVEDFNFVQEVKQTKNIVRRDRYVVIKNGKKVYYNMIFQPIIDCCGKITEVIVIGIDVTHEVEAKEQAEMSLNMKNEFFSFISHEFKTPLTVINSAIQAMELICGNELSQKARGFLTKIRQNSYRQLRLINDLLDITRAESGYLKLHKRNFDIVVLTKNITESVSIYAKEKEIELDFISSVPEEVIGIDEEKYERILLNLLSNAIKFTRKGGSIHVRVYKKNQKLYVEVKDEGVGIPRDRQHVIFERFGQVDSSLTRQAEGAGIGLALVKRLIGALEGEIDLESEEGKGSIFTIALPAQKVQDEEFWDSGAQEINDDRLLQAVQIEFSDIYLSK